MTTIKDVASRAGVGIGTVSRVLNDHPAVTDETRQRVLDAIAALDYHPSRVARALSRHRLGTGAIAVVVPFATYPSAVERLRGVISALESSPYEAILFNADHADHTPVRLARAARRDLVDGLIVVSLPLAADDLRLLDRRALPTVVVDADAPQFPNVVVDDIGGGRLAARHLLDLGHTRIGYLGDVMDPRFGFTSGARRQEGLARELAEAGHPLDERYVQPSRHDRDLARSLALDLLTLPDRPTAIFAHSDVQALSVLEAADILHIKVPDQLSVIGFDDIEVASHVGLTTVRQPLFESGRLGAERLLELLANELHDEPRRVELPLQVIVRRTTAPPPSRARRAARSVASSTA